MKPPEVFNYKPFLNWEDSRAATIFALIWILPEAVAEKLLKCKLCKTLGNTELNKNRLSLLDYAIQWDTPDRARNCLAYGLPDLKRKANF